MKKEALQVDKNNTVISIEGLEKSFGSLQVLKSLNLQVYKGENMVLLGRSGSGKSVLIKIIVGLMYPDRGSVKVLGQEVDKLDTKEMDAFRLKIGFSFQGSALYDSMTVRENLEFPLIKNKRDLDSREVNKAIEGVLSDVGLLKTIDQWPSELSGGQKKRVGIARTLILRPEIMLYDEPTSGLDPASSLEIIKLINEVQQKYHTSSIIITHDLTCAKFTGERIAVLLNGTIERLGSFDEVFDTDDPDIMSFYNYNFINES
jgi:phospholipid/cholesterol/gamma-HCH transport system ATP-binding protein